MKNKLIIYLSVSWLAALASGVTAKSEILVVNHPFILMPGTDPYDPMNYVEYLGNDPFNDCPGRVEICIIDIPDTDIYTWLDAPDPLYEGKPKVDIQHIGTTDLADDILYALNHSFDPVIRNNRVIYLRAHSD